MSNIRDLTGMRFGRQIAIRQAGKNAYGNILWLCKCDCGNEHTVASGKLVSGKSKSCGCLAEDVRRAMLTKHGITSHGKKPRTFIIWNGMKARCFNPKCISYKSYGGRGITICDEWLTFENFHKWAINNGYSDGLQIDRIDNNGNYEPNNCQWVNAHDNRVKQRKNRYITVSGETRTISDWIRVTGVSKSTAYKYLNKGETEFIKLIEARLRSEVIA